MAGDIGLGLGLWLGCRARIEDMAGDIGLGLGLWLGI